MRIITIWAVLFFSMFLSAEGFSQIYKYTDQDGNIRFTDNMANIPESKRNSVKTIEEIKSSPKTLEEESGKTVEGNSSLLPEENASGQTSDATSGPDKELDKEVIEKFRKAKASMDSEREEIKSLQEQIEKEKIDLGDPPPESATNDEKREYQQRALNLNSQIRQYQEKVDAYEQKVKPFKNMAPSKTIQ